MKLAEVYKITNTLNGKIYFGYTTMGIRQRFSNHCGSSNCSYLYNAIKHHGRDNFTMEVLYTYESEHEAKSTEIYLIAKYKTNLCRYRDGYGMNMTDGGEGTHGRFGHVHNDETKSMMSIKQSGKNNHFYGKSHSDKTREMMSNNSKNKHKVLQYDLDGNFMNLFESHSDAEKVTGVKFYCISFCCAGKQKTAGGYIWRNYEV